MSFLVNDVVANVRKVYPDMSSADAIDALNQVRRRLMSAKFPLFRDLETISTITSGTKEYNLSSDILNISRVEYHTSSSAFSQLLPIDEEHNNDIKQGWTADANGAPTSFYLKAGEGGATDGPLIGLHPTPNVTTSGGYPLLKVFGTKATVALAAGGTFYDDLPNTLVLEYGACSIFASREDREAVPLYLSLYQAELQALDAYYADKNQHLPESTNTRLKNLKAA